jgi:hypothetical protein
LRAVGKLTLSQSQTTGRAIAATKIVGIVTYHFIIRLCITSRIHIPDVLHNTGYRGADHTDTERRHYLSYYRRTVAHNSILVYDPHERFFWSVSLPIRSTTFRSELSRGIQKMNWLRRPLHKSRAESELDEELRFHVAHQPVNR